MRSSTRRSLWMLVSLLIATTAPLSVFAEDVGAIYQKSYDLEAAGQYTEALEAVKALPSEEARSYTAQLRSGWLHYLSGRYADAIEAYKDAAKAAPDAVEPRLGMMLPQMALRLWKDAEATARGVLEVDPKSYLATSRLAWSLYNLGRYEDAAASYAAVLKLYPSDVEMQAGLAWSMLKMGKAGEAKALFQAVLKVAPRHLSAQQGLVACGS